MRMPLLLGIAASMAMVSTHAPIAAQAPPSSPAADPNEKVCENIVAIGSRLAKKRVCASRAEWEERRRLDREAVESAQKMIGGPCQTTPSARNGGPTAC
jgi:hypothetical protein